MRFKVLFLIILFMVLFALFPLCSHAYAQASQPSGAQISVPPPPDTASALQLEETADTLRARKDYQHAITYYRAALLQDPKNAVLFNKCGIAALQLNNTAAAKKDFKRALKLNPQYAEALNNMGAAYYMERNYKKAIREYSKAIVQRDDMASFYANLGTAWFARKKIDQAMEQFARALQLDPQVLLRTSQSGIAAQISSPEDRAHFNYVLAKLFARQGNIDQSVEYLRRAKELGFAHLNDVYKDPEFTAVRTDPRFTGAMLEVGQ